MARMSPWKLAIDFLFILAADTSHVSHCYHTCRPSLSGNSQGYLVLWHIVMWRGELLRMISLPRDMTRQTTSAGKVCYSNSKQSLIESVFMREDVLMVRWWGTTGLRMMRLQPTLLNKVDIMNMRACILMIWPIAIACLQQHRAYQPGKISAALPKSQLLQVPAHCRGFGHIGKVKGLERERRGM